MKLNITLLSLLFLLFVSCGKKDTKTPDSGGPDVSQDDDKKYGKTILLGKQTYTINKFEKIKHGSNMDYMELTIDAAKTDNHEALKLFAHVLRVDRKSLSKDFSVEALSGGQYIADRASPQDIMKNQTNTKREVLAIVNGDFFTQAEGGTMLGGLINNGGIIKTANSDWRLTYGITKTNEFFIDELNYSMTVGADNFIIDGINVPRGANNLILYTTFRGEKTGVNQFGGEILLKPLIGDWESLPNYENVTCEVVSNLTVIAGGLEIPKGHIVLSGNAAGLGFVNRYKKGDKLIIKIGKSKGKSGKIYDVKEAIGAAYPILAQGDVKLVNSSAGNPTGKEPRTAIGHSNDFFYMVAVEGGSTKSDGLTVTDLAYLLKHFDVKDAVNLDGGGSTMLAVGDKIYGQPAGTTSFRPVPNAFAIVKKN